MNDFSLRHNLFNSEQPSSMDANTTPEPNNQIEEVQSEHRVLVTPAPNPTVPVEEGKTGTGERPTAAAPAPAQDERRTQLFTPTEANDLRAKWESIQIAFVDEPRRAVKEADDLVSLTTKRLAELFADEHQKMEQQWDRGSDISTEDLRQSLRRYRSFFTRLLSI